MKKDPKNLLGDVHNLPAPGNRRDPGDACRPGPAPLAATVSLALDQTPHSPPHGLLQPAETAGPGVILYLRFLIQTSFHQAKN